MILSIIIISLISIILLLFGVGHDISIDKQALLVSTLKDVAAIIFGVIGAWIAILYPEKLFTAYKKSDDDQLKSFDNLIRPMLCATLIIAYCLIFNVIRPVLSKFDFLLKYVAFYRSLSYCVIVFFTLFLLWNLLVSLFPMDILRRRIELEQQKNKNVNIYTRTNNDKKKAD